MTVVNKTKGGIGLSLDINSCYPAGQSNNMPLIHKSVTEPDEHRVTNGYMNRDEHLQYVNM